MIDTSSYDEQQVYLDTDEIALAARQLVWTVGPQKVYDDGADSVTEYVVRIKDRWDYRHLTDAEGKLVLAEAVRQADHVSDLLGLTRFGHDVNDPGELALEALNIDGMTITPRSDQYQFFYTHAGYSYDPATETEEQGRERTAYQLAIAENQAKARGWWISVDDDDDGPMEDDAGSVEAVEAGEMLCLEVALYGPYYRDDDGLDGEVETLGHVGDVIVPSHDDPYIRVVAAQLALEAINIEGQGDVLAEDKKVADDMSEPIEEVIRIRTQRRDDNDDRITALETELHELYALRKQLTKDLHAALRDKAREAVKRWPEIPQGM